MNQAIERVMFSPEQLSDAVKEIGARITADYSGKKPLIVGILKGSVVFFADLIRAIDLPCELDFLTVSSYGASAVSSGTVTLKKDLDTDIENRDVILVEDILDTGRTLYCVREILEQRKPASVRICALLDKKVEKTADIHADYKCFDIENEFVVGYGLDYAQQFRNLPYVGILKREIYEK